ncbi:hypothetical protein RND81_04G069000 [Saponaria officinalis]|uniref:Thylakoid membrane protein TERC, chloroplastic n=1 Tax=Saponaria officinalis TaxID=3572 RepID=A0AAW1LJL3_SAPOF
MGVTSVMYNGVHSISPLKSNHKNLIYLPSFTSTSTSTSFSALYSSRPQFLLLRSGGFSRLRNIAVVFARSTEEDDVLSAASERNGDSMKSRNESVDDSQTHLSSSGANSVNESRESDGYTSSVRTVILCVSAAVAFGIGLGFKDGVGKASEFFAGYLLEQSLSVDNLFVFVLIFKYFKVPLMYQNRVLSYGIAGAVVFRLSLILLGTATLQRFEAVNLLLASILLYSSFKLFQSEEEDEDLSDNFIVKTCQKFIPVTANYDGNHFFTIEDGVRKASKLWAGYTLASHCSCY